MSARVRACVCGRVQYDCMSVCLCACECARGCMSGWAVGGWVDATVRGSVEIRVVVCPNGRAVGIRFSGWMRPSG